MEVAGIEPASSGSAMGLLRAQPAVAFGIGSPAGARADPYPVGGFPAEVTGGPRAGESHNMTPESGPWDWGRLGVAT